MNLPNLNKMRSCGKGTQKNAYREKGMTFAQHMSAKEGRKNNYARKLMHKQQQSDTE